jgi:hypothetical protein
LKNNLLYNANMAKMRLRKSLNTLKNFFTPLQSQKADDDHFRLGPTLEPYSTQRQQMAQSSPHTVSRHSSREFVPSDDEVERMNRDRLEQAKLSQTYEQIAQSREALNLTLKSQQRLLVATLITALVALIVGIISLVNKPPVVNVQPPDVHINVKPQ